MTRPGMMVMLKALGSNDESVKAWQSAVNKRIAALEIDDEANGGDGALRFTFDDGTRLDLLDSGRSCCESRYMRTDDDLAYHVGATLLDAEVSEADDPVGDEWAVHEVAFLRVTTSKGVITVATHNEHNGYYGGFLIEARVQAETEGESDGVL